MWFLKEIVEKWEWIARRRKGAGEKTIFIGFIFSVISSCNEWILKCSQRFRRDLPNYRFAGVIVGIPQAELPSGGK